MALSNLKNEPRREIIEQAAGVLAIVCFLFGNYAFVKWMGAEKPVDIVCGMIITAMVVPFAVMFLTFGIHVIGEAVCGVLAGLGLDPRPSQRYRR